MPSLETHPAPAKRPALLPPREPTSSQQLRLQPLAPEYKVLRHQTATAWVAAKVEIRGRGGFS